MSGSSRCKARQKVSTSNKYVVYEDDDPILSAKRKKFKPKEDFRLDGHDTSEKRLRVKVGSILDVSAVYDITDSRTDKRVGAVRRGAFSFAKHTYQPLDPDGSVAGRVVENSIPMAVAGRLVATLIPFSCHIGDVTDGKAGAVDRQFSLRDKYTVDVDRRRVDSQFAVVSAVVVDAIEED